MSVHNGVNRTRGSSASGAVKRLPVVIIVLSALVAAAGYAYWSRTDREGNGGYVTETIQRGPIASTVTATGTVNPVTTVQVGTYVSGPIRAIDVDFNSEVKKGQRVAKIDPAPFQVKVQEAEANLANARAKVDKDRADLALKKLTLVRNRQLMAKNLISQNDVDTAKSNADQAVAQVALDAAGVQQAEASLQEARINLAYTDITSPVDGVVVSRNVDVGQTVAASFQTPTLFLIAQDLTKMEVDTNVSESDIGDVRSGQHAAFTVDAYPGKLFAGTVFQVRNAPTTVQNVVTYDVVIAVDNRALELKPGMTATVTITTAQRDAALKIPLRALRFNPERKPASAEETPASRPSTIRAGATGGREAPVVWAVQPDGSLRKIEVQLGVRNDQYAELLSEQLHAGDQLAVAFKHGAQRKTEQRPPTLGGGRFR
jgi:HlyD family secretion protein